MTTVLAAGFIQPKVRHTFIWHLHAADPGSTALGLPPRRRRQCAGLQYILVKMLTVYNTDALYASYSGLLSILTQRLHVPLWYVRSPRNVRLQPLRGSCICYTSTWSLWVKAEVQVRGCRAFDGLAMISRPLAATKGLPPLSNSSGFVALRNTLGLQTAQSRSDLCA